MKKIILNCAAGLNPFGKELVKENIEEDYSSFSSQGDLKKYTLSSGTIVTEVRWSGLSRHGISGN